MQRRPLSYSPPRAASNSIAKRLLFVTTMVIVLPVITPVWISYVFSASLTSFPDSFRDFVASGDMALAAIFLITAVVCDMAIKGRAVGFVTIVSCLIFLSALPIYVKSRLNYLSVDAVHGLDSRVYVTSIVCYVLAAIFTLVSQLDEGAN